MMWSLNNFKIVLIVLACLALGILSSVPVAQAQGDLDLGVPLWGDIYNIGLWGAEEPAVAEVEEEEEDLMELLERLKNIALPQWAQRTATLPSWAPSGALEEWKEWKGDISLGVPEWARNLPQLDIFGGEGLTFPGWPPFPPR